MNNYPVLVYLFEKMFWITLGFYAGCLASYSCLLHIKAPIEFHLMFAPFLLFWAFIADRIRINKEKEK